MIRLHYTPVAPRVPSSLDGRISITMGPSLSSSCSFPPLLRDRLVLVWTTRFDLVRLSLEEAVRSARFFMPLTTLAAFARRSSFFAMRLLFCILTLHARGRKSSSRNAATLSNPPWKREEHVPPTSQCGTQRRTEHAIEGTDCIVGSAPIRTVPLGILQKTSHQALTTHRLFLHQRPPQPRPETQGNMEHVSWHLKQAPS